MTVGQEIFQTNQTVHLPLALINNSAVAMVNVLRVAGDVMGLMIVVMALMN